MVVSKIVESKIDKAKKKVAIIGAGPIGIETALAFRSWGFEVAVFEAHSSIGASVERWSHVTFFSPWKLNTSARGLKALKEGGHELPDPDLFPTGEEYLSAYLRPIADHPLLVDSIHLNSRVRSIAREGVLKGEWIGSPRRKERPFRILIEDSHGEERVERAQIVIDTSGTYEMPNSLGDGGIGALGEKKARSKGLVQSYIPDLKGESLRGQHLAVVGSGYSAITTLALLLNQSDERRPSKITWVMRSADLPYERMEEDPLPQRDELAQLGNRLASGDDPRVEVLQEVHVESLELDPQGTLSLGLHNGVGMKRVEKIDKLFAHVGYRPDLEMTRELQVHQCYASEGPMKLAAALLGASGGSSDCLAQTSLGPETLKSPEPDFFILGSKSYGRRSDFLLKLGLEQIEEVQTLLDSEHSGPR